ncbi:MAG: hypothetical protein WC314_13080 [Vulcanimicrobiota bacterium]
MFDFLGPLGAIQSPQGSLSFGHVGLTNCVYFSYRSEADFVPTLIYSPDELAELITLVEVAAEEIKTIEQGTTLRIGSMRAKPMVLRLALICPADRGPFLLLRILQGNWAQDIATSPEALLSLLKMGQVEGPEPVVGPLEKGDDGSWKVAGETFKIVQGLTPGVGRSGEYLHPDEVDAGEVVELWSFPTEERKLVACFRLKEKHSHHDTGEGGTRVEQLLARGQNHLARIEVLKFCQKHSAGEKTPASSVARASLAYLLAEISDGDDTSGHRVWLGQSDNKFLRQGIDFLEAGRVSPHDFLIYQQVSAYFHSLNPDAAGAKAAVNNLMAKVCGECTRNHPHLLRAALSNWYLYLKEIFEGEPPPEALTEWNRAVQKSGLKVVPKALRFPSPSSWASEDDLPSVLPSSKEVEGDSTPVLTNPKKTLIAAILILLVALFIFPSSNSEANSPASSQAAEFTGKTSFSIGGVSLEQTWDELSENRDWDIKDKTILSSHVENGYHTVRFDSNDRLRSIEGPELSQDGTVVFSNGTPIKTIRSRWGEPSQSRGHELIYIYDDAGVKCSVTLQFNGSHLWAVRLSKAGNRWQDTPGLPILGK